MSHPFTVVRRTMLIVWAPLLGLGLTIGAACGGSSSSDVIASPPKPTAVDASTERPYTLDDVCKRTAPLICAIRKPCCERSVGFDEAACLAQAEAECAKDVADVRGGRATFYPERIDACLPKIEAILSSCVLTFDLLQKHAREIDTCRAFSGQLVIGSSCERATQCTPGGPDETIGCDEATKKCRTTKLVGEGGACSLRDGLPQICDDGLYCDVDFTSDAGTLAGTCKRKTPLGAPCKKDKKPPSLECGLGNYCDSATALCTTGKGANAACTNGMECASVDCIVPDGGVTGTCKAPGSLVKPVECNRQ